MREMRKLKKQACTAQRLGKACGAPAVGPEYLLCSWHRPEAAETVAAVQRLIRGGRAPNDDARQRAAFLCLKGRKAV